MLQYQITPVGDTTLRLEGDPAALERIQSELLNYGQDSNWCAGVIYEWGRPNHTLLTLSDSPDVIRAVQGWLLDEPDTGLPASSPRFLITC